ncbi:MAG: type II secretion system F family protein [Thermoleophilaceae bacterium]
MTTALPAFVAAVLAVLGLGVLAPSRPGRRREAPKALRALAALGAGTRGRRRAPQDLERRILAAGRPGGLGVRELWAAKVSATVVGAGVGALLGAVAPGRLGFLIVVAVPVGGFLGPDLWLRRRAADRARRVRRELPALLDLLRVTVAAGAALAAALGEVGGRATGPLAQEWAAVGQEVELGVPLGEALAAMSLRLPQPEVVALCAALDRARRHGTPLADALAGQARDARLALRRRVAEDAAKAGPKIQLVVALLLVPSVLLLVAAALVAALLGSGGVTAIQ